MIVFQKTEKTSRTRNPFRNFEEDMVTFEYRTDPRRPREACRKNQNLPFEQRELEKIQQTKASHL